MEVWAWGRDSDGGLFCGGTPSKIQRLKFVQTLFSGLTGQGVLLTNMLGQVIPYQVPKGLEPGIIPP